MNVLCMLETMFENNIIALTVCDDIDRIFSSDIGQF